MSNLPIQSILLVDDTPDNLKVLFNLLKPENFDLRIAMTGEAALEALRLKSADLILLDVEMPGIDGFETCRRLKADSSLGEIPIIFMTALNDVTHKVHGLELGAVDYITKPFESSEVLARIRVHLKLRQVSQQLQQQSTQLEQLNTQLEQRVRDRTQALQASEEKFQQIANNLEQVLWIYEPAAHAFTYLSPAYQTLWGEAVPASPLALKSWLKHIHPDDVATVTASIEVALQSGDLDHEYRIINNDGAIRWIHSRAFSINDQAGNLYRLTGISEDTTQKKLAEKSALKSLAKEQELSDLKSRFITTTSHEFRTPLAVISSNVEMLQLFEDKLSNQEKKDCLAEIMEYVDKSVLLLEDFLVFSGVEAQSMSVKPDALELQKFWQDLALQFKAEFHERELLFESHEHRPLQEEMDYSIYWDAKIVHQTLKLLIKNAILYSPSSTSVNIQLDIQPDQISITVKDQGIGIPSVDMPHVFEPFHRGLNIETRSGTGMGLTTAKHLMTIHQSQIDIESELNVGTTCNIALPWSISSDTSTNLFIQDHAALMPHSTAVSMASGASALAVTTNSLS